MDFYVIRHRMGKAWVAPELWRTLGAHWFSIPNDTFWIIEHWPCEGTYHVLVSRRPLRALPALRGANADD